MSSSRFAMALGAIALCVAVGGVVMAQDAREYDQSTPAPVAHVVAPPFEGEVTCDRLSVRIFPKADEKTKVVTVFKRGHKLHVVGESGEFWAIAPWDDAGDCFVWAKNVDRSGDEATVTVDSAPVRWDTRTNAEKLCDLPKGTKVQVVAALHSSTWYEIKPPAGVNFFVHKKYVKKTGDATPAVTPTTPGPTPAADLDAEAREWMTKANAEAQAQTGSQTPDFSNAITMYKTAADMSHNDSLKAAATSLAIGCENNQALWDRMNATSRMSAADRQKWEKMMADMKAQLEKAGKPRTHIRQGYLETVGMLPNRPAEFRLLTPEGNTICYLKMPGDENQAESVRRRFDNHYHQWMRISGTVLPADMQYEGVDVVVIDDAWEWQAPRPLIER